MKKSEIEVGMTVGFKSGTEHYGVVKKVKGFEAVVLVYDGETGDDIEYTISIERLEKE